MIQDKLLCPHCGKEISFIEIFNAVELIRGDKGYRFVEQKDRNNLYCEECNFLADGIEIISGLMPADEPVPFIRVIFKYDMDNIIKTSDQIVRWDRSE